MTEKDYMLYGTKMIDEFQITEQEFKELNQRVENIYNALVVVDYFCINQPEIEELYNIAPIITNLRRDADYLNAFFINKGNID